MEGSVRKAISIAEGSFDDGEPDEGAIVAASDAMRTCFGVNAVPGTTPSWSHRRHCSSNGPAGMFGGRGAGSAPSPVPVGALWLQNSRTMS